MSNPFYDAMDDSLRGRRVEVITAQDRVYSGWVDRIHHSQRTVLLHDASLISDDGDVADFGTTMVHNAVEVAAVDPQSRIERLSLRAIQPSPYHQREFEESENRGYVADVRDTGYVGSYPVVRPIDGDLDHPGAEGFEVVEGHKRVWACRQAGVTTHPFRVVDVDDWAAARRFVADHIPDRGQTDADGTPGGCYAGEDLVAALETLVERWGDRAFELDRVRFNVERLDLDGAEAAIREFGQRVQEATDVADESDTGDESEGSDVHIDNGGGPDVSDLPNPTTSGDPFHGEGADARVDHSDADVEADPDDGEDEPIEEEIGVYTARDYGLSLSSVASHIDADRVTVVDRPYGGDLVPGTNVEGPDYAVQDHNVQLGNPGRKAVGAAPDQDVRAVRDGEGVRLELVDDPAEGGEQTGSAEAATADGGVAVQTAVSTDTAASVTCQNCGSQVTRQYARTFAPEDQEDVGPRVCPNCEDKVRDGSEVRLRRDQGQHLEGDDD